MSNYHLSLNSTYPTDVSFVARKILKCKWRYEQWLFIDYSEQLFTLADDDNVDASI